ncbi:ferritin-like domain-containing protein [Candidatus Saccharibacteria bacterium]|nr:ferritin-like domain-containing protein [Candidatus Saccharibacteria bacterium]
MRLQEQVLTTSEVWWDKVKDNELLLNDWLRKQYHGEVTAADRINSFAEQYAEDGSRAQRLLGIIASQETDHARWVGDLLVARGIEPVVLEKEERYWDSTLPQIASFATGAAVAAHAEHMRLERIRTISADPSAPADIKRVFDRILPQEVFHERAFTSLAGEEAMQDTQAAHELGRVSIGLFPEDF